MSYPLPKIIFDPPDQGLQAMFTKVNTAIDLLNNPYLRHLEVSGTYTLKLDHVGFGIWLRGGDPFSVIVPQNSGIGFPSFAVFFFQGIDTGTYTLSAASGVTINGVSGGSCTLDRHKVQILMRGTGDGWILSGSHSTIV